MRLVQYLQQIMDLALLKDEALSINVGICSNLYYLSNFRYDEDDITKYFYSWKHFSGDYRYPVPYPSLDPDKAFLTIDNLWVGEYGELRIDLLQHLIDSVDRWS